MTAYQGVHVDVNVGLWKHVDGEGSMMMVTYQGEHSRQLRAVYLASLLLPD